MAGRLALNRTVKLGQLIPEWGDEAYITVSPMLTADMAEFANGRDNEENQDTEKLANEMLVWVIKKYRDWETDRKSTRLNSSHSAKSRMPSSA